MSDRGEIIAESAVRFVRLFPAPSGLRSAGAATATSPAGPDGRGGGGAVNSVWRFLTDTALLPQWYGEGVIEPREGGAIHLMGGHVRGVVTGWRPPEFLAYTWNVFSPGESVSRFPISYLEFALAAEDGGTRLTLTHRPIPAAMQPQTAMGWHTFVDLLAAGLNGDFPARAALFPRNAALYGEDINTLER
jgi:uncharacterized protein YndB with AHSA1/START domain